MANSTAHTNILSPFKQKVEDYKMLFKLRLSGLVVFTAILGYLLVAGASWTWSSILILGLGGFMITGASNALNQVFEKDFDALMERTKNRPLAAGRMTISEAVMAAGLMSLGGITLLALFNPLTAFLGTLSLVSYAFVYTPLKRYSPVSVLVGAFPGAFPIMIGCVAFEGEISYYAWLLFGIQFLWQFPHFWAIGWNSFEDYQKAGYKLLPLKNQRLDPKIGLYSFLYAIMLVPLSAILYMADIHSVYCMILLIALAGFYTYKAWNLYKQADKKAALGLMFSSFIYLPVALLILYADQIIF